MIILARSFVLDPYTLLLKTGDTEEVNIKNTGNNTEESNMKKRKTENEMKVDHDNMINHVGNSGKEEIEDEIEDEMRDEDDEEDEEEEEDSDVLSICKEINSKEPRQETSQVDNDGTNVNDTSLIENRQVEVLLSDTSVKCGDNNDIFDDAFDVDNDTESEDRSIANDDQNLNDTTHNESFVGVLNLPSVKNDNDLRNNTNDNKNRTRDRKSLSCVVCDSGDNLKNIIFDSNNNKNVTSNIKISNETQLKLNKNGINDNVTNARFKSSPNYANQVADCDHGSSVLKLSRDMGNSVKSTSFVENSESVSSRSTITMCNDNGDDTYLASFSVDNRSNIDREHTKNTTIKTNKLFLGQSDSGTCFF